MEDDPDLQLIDDGLYQPPSPLVSTTLLPRPPRLVIPSDEDDEDEVDPSRILLPPSPIPPELEDEEDKDLAPKTTSQDPVSKEEVSVDEKLCRICFGGEEDEDECGRLISPCVCTGSMRHVHVKCLSRWRTSSANKAAFWSCPQCSFKYHFARTRVSGIATNPLAITLTTILLFLTLTLVSGHLLHLFLSSYIPVPSSLSDQPIPAHSFAEILLDDPPDLGLVRYAPSSTAFEIVRGAVGVFAGGEAEEVLKGLWGLVVEGFTYLSGKEEDETEGLGTWLKEGLKIFKTWFTSLSSLFISSTSTDAPPSVLSHYNPLTSSLLQAAFYRFTLGISLIGSLSFISLLLSLSLLPLFSLFNTWNLPRFARIGRRGRARPAAGVGGLAIGGAGGPGVGAVVMVGMVGIGIVRTLIGLYKTIQGWSSRLLHRAETAILEVSPSGHELRAATPRSEEERVPGQVGQRVVWDPPGGWVEED